MTQHSTAHNLPVEIIEYIFQWCSSWKYHPTLHHRLAWTQVCRRWRNIALKYPLLWNDIDLSHSHVDLTCEYIRRSSPTTALSINTISFPFKLQEVAYQYILRSADVKIGTLDIQLFADDLSKVLNALSPQLNSRVTRLSLRTPNYGSSRQDVLSLPLAHVVGALSLDRVAFDYDGTRIDNLTHLSIKGMQSPSMISPSRLLEVLRDSPNLEHINIIGNHWSAQADDTSEQGPIVLPYLQELTLSAPKNVISSLADHLTVAEDACVTLFIQASPPIDLAFPVPMRYNGAMRWPSRLQSITRIPPKLAFRLDQGRFRLYPRSAMAANQRNLGLDSDLGAPWSNDGFLGHLSSVAFAPTFPLGPIPYQTLNDGSHNNGISCCSILGSFQSTVNPTSVQCLEITMGALDGIGKAHIHTFVSRLTFLESVSISYQAMFLQSAEIPPHDEFFDLLELISKTNEGLKRIVFGSSAQLWPSFAKLHLPAVAKCLKNRGERLGKPLPEVHFYSCHGIKRLELDAGPIVLGEPHSDLVRQWATRVYVK